ncbi:MAG: MBL fold metallo-hydrolase [Holophagales bacterium]|nr:MBL fold metallo-hydrolase [Holophagales bacterium]MYD23556.1 MBL fold metallo-hydrolase [Holophagales bacterium]MYI31376.1 MBL fold metallo-hydrolase [Holophagales bacterium]
MTRSTTVLLSLCAASLLVSGVAAEEHAIETETHRFEEVADGVYFVSGTGAMVTRSNAMVVVTEEDVLVVDSHITPAAARALIEGIERITDKPIRTLVNTHFHYDHSHGNQAFGPDVRVVGHEYTRHKMATAPLEEHTFKGSSERDKLALEELRAALETASEEEREDLETQISIQAAHVESTAEIHPVPPDTTLAEKMSFFSGGREIQLHFLGRAHTGGDVVVYLPAERLVFTGDMMLGGPPWPGDGWVNEWPATLERLKQLDFDLILPGHGPYFRDRELIDHVQAFHRELWEVVSGLHAQGVPAEDAVERIDLSHHAENLPPARVRVDLRGVQRMYMVLDGTAN